MPQPNDLNRSLAALDHNSTIIAVDELRQSSWLVGGVVPGIKRRPRKKLEPSPERLLAVLHRWRDDTELMDHVRLDSTRPHRQSEAGDAGVDTTRAGGLRHRRLSPV